MRQPGSENDGTDFPASWDFQKFSASKAACSTRLACWCRFCAPANRYSQIQNQPVARGSADHAQLIHDRAHHSVANHGQDGFAHRTVGDDADAARRLRQCGLYLFYSGNFGNADLRAFCLRLGLSHSRAPRFVRLAVEENGSPSEAVSIAAVGVCPAYRRAVHVCLAHRVSIFLKFGARADHPEIHESSGDH